MTNEELDKLEAADFEGATVPAYEDMNREELIECLHAHDAHHKEHHERESALTNSVPVEVVREAMAAMKSAQDIFHHYGDLHQAKGTDEGNEKAFVNRAHAAALGAVIRELELWVGEVE